MYLLFQAVSALHVLHSCGIIHGDIKTDNFVLKSSADSKVGFATHLIDFGRSKVVTFDDRNNNAIQNAMIQKAHLSGEPELMWSSQSYCTFLDSSGASSADYQADFYNLLNCIHQLLYFENLSTIRDSDGSLMPKMKFKRYWNQELWTDIFSSLLNSKADIVSKARLSEIEGLIARMQLAFQNQLDSKKFNVSRLNMIIVYYSSLTVFHTCR